MSDEHDDRVFDYLISRTSSRESASIAVVGLASSSSLVFLGLISSQNNFHWEFFAIGIIFPVLAFTYNEITNRGLHKDDQKIINDLIAKTNSEKWKHETEPNIINEKRRLLRLVLMRYAFLSPILGWLIILPIQFELNLIHTILADFVFGGIILGICLLIGLTNKIKR